MGGGATGDALDAPATAALPAADAAGGATPLELAAEGGTSDVAGLATRAS
jgi:hypothetical protein